MNETLSDYIIRMEETHIKYTAADRAKPGILWAQYCEIPKLLKIIRALKDGATALDSRDHSDVLVMTMKRCLRESHDIINGCQVNQEFPAGHTSHLVNVKPILRPI